MLKTKVLAHFKGSQVAVARALGITRGAVFNWGSIVPEQSAVRLYLLTDGKLKYNPKTYEKPVNTRRGGVMRTGRNAKAGAA